MELVSVMVNLRILRKHDTRLRSEDGGWGYIDKSLSAAAAARIFMVPQRGFPASGWEIIEVLTSHYTPASFRAPLTLIYC